MEVTFYTFKKRVNSTKIVNVNGTNIPFRYKSASDMHNPTIEVSQWNNTWNYARIDNIYFFVSNVTHVYNNMWSVSLNIDLLATYREDILSTGAFIRRSSSNYDINIVDEMNSELTSVNEISLSKSPMLDETQLYDTGDGCYIMHTMNSITEPIHGGLNACYILTAKQMNDISRILMTADQTILDQIGEYFAKPIDAITKVMWLPLNVSIVINQTGASSTKVYIGKYDTNITAYHVTNNFIEVSTVFDLSNYYPNGYLRNINYTSATLTLPFIGTVGIDCKRLFENHLNDDLRVDIAIDVRNGKQLVLVRTCEHVTTPINIFESNLGYEVQISATQFNLMGGVSNLLNGLAFTTNPKTAPYGLSSLANALADTITPSSSSVGASGGNMAFIALGGNIRLSIISRETEYDIENESVKNIIGLPLNHVMLLADISGYVITEKASVSANAYINELTTINNMLNGGVYIE